MEKKEEFGLEVKKLIQENKKLMNQSIAIGFVLGFGIGVLFSILVYVLINN